VLVFVELDSLERAWMARMGWDGMLAACCLLLAACRHGVGVGYSRYMNAVLPFCSFLFSCLSSSDICLIAILKTFHSKTYTYRDLKHGFHRENYCCVGWHGY
jgi:hypothetical protein